jgi:hypothetical protein
MRQHRSGEIEAPDYRLVQPPLHLLRYDLREHQLFGEILRSNNDVPRTRTSGQQRESTRDDRDKLTPELHAETIIGYPEER